MRLDRHLTEHHGIESRTRARALIEAGLVMLNGVPATRPAQMVPPGATIAVMAEAMPWVSRGALKLLHALDAFDLDPSGANAWDLGASTGGFTEVLLARGAAHVTAIDVGHGQLHPRLAGHSQVTAVEGVNVRTLPEGLPAETPAPDWLTADLSFIALSKALPAALALAAPGAHLVVLVKPQFELGREAIGRGGLVRDAALRVKAPAMVAELLSGLGWSVLGQTDSPITGGDGNHEYLLAARNQPS